MLAIMSLFGYLFVVRTLYHSHQVDVSRLVEVVDAEGNVVGKTGRTTYDDYHRHEFELDAKGNSRLDASGNSTVQMTNEHTHKITNVGSVEEPKYVVSGPEGFLRARVPQYGRLRFLDRRGAPAPRGISVGSEWTYRSFIEGGSAAAAVWMLDGVDESVLGTDSEGKKYLPLELIVRVFRSYKGNIEEGIQGSIRLRNPDNPNVKSNEDPFTAEDASINMFDIPVKLYDGQKEIDLLTDLVTKDGRLEVVVQCLDSAQYFGFAQPDLYLRLPDASPGLNYVKAQIGIWVQMVLVIAIAVTASTLLNGPVAMLFTVSFILLGFFKSFFVAVATGRQVGGGPIESLVRLVTQKNQMTGLDRSFGVQVMEWIDWVLKQAMLSLAQVLPDFRSFSTVDYVAYGFSIPANKISQDTAVTAAYVLGLCVIGYFCLRTREVAK
jgi:hypothetical protein